MSERVRGRQEIIVLDDIALTDTEMSVEEIKSTMAEYRKRHPEEFSGTPEWSIKVTAENVSRVYDETGILFWPL